MELNKSDIRIVVSLLWNEGVPHNFEKVDGKRVYVAHELRTKYRFLARKIYNAYPDLFKGKYNQEVISGWLLGGKADGTG